VVVATVETLVKVAMAVVVLILVVLILPEVMALQVAIQVAMAAMVPMAAMAVLEPRMAQVSVETHPVVVAAAVKPVEEGGQLRIPEAQVLMVKSL
jgi:hypothetical protein